jgi:hypothetical protein
MNSFLINNLNFECDFTSLNSFIVQKNYNYDSPNKLPNYVFSQHLNAMICKVKVIFIFQSSNWRMPNCGYKQTILNPPQDFYICKTTHYLKT